MASTNQNQDNTNSGSNQVNQGNLTGETPQQKSQYKTANVRSKLKGKDQTKTMGRNPKLNGTVQLSFSTCYKSIANVNISRRGLLALEMAVGLAVFVDFGAANRAAKQMVSDVYAKAGYECQTPEGKDYKTVRRRIDASSGLYGKLTGDVVSQWMKDKSENKLLQAVAHEISKLNFNSMDDILDFIGRASNRSAQRTPSEGVGASASSNPYDIEVGDGKLVHIPRSLSEAELIELAQKILVLAEEVKIKEVKDERRVNVVQVDSDRRNQSKSNGDRLH